MRLSNLNPRWYTQGNSPDIVGMTFDCPCEKCEPARRKAGLLPSADAYERECAFMEQGGARLGVLFKNEIDRDGLPNQVHWARAQEQTSWTRSGDSFDTLTLSPSVDASKVGHWHGLVSNGEAR